MSTSATTPTSSRVAPRDTLVEVSAVNKGFGDGAAYREVLSGIDLDVRSREIIAIIGASGSGKSTLLRLIGGLDRPSSGTITIDGEPVRSFEPRCAVSFQEPRLLPWRTVFENVKLGLPRGVGKKDGAERVGRLLDLVQLGDFHAHKPREISGGMAQRASLARALARSPRLLLLDEPFGALDALTRLTMQTLLLDIHRAESSAIVLVTHDVNEALTLADRIIVLGTATGTNGAAPVGATIIRSVAPTDARPRSPSSREIAELRIELLRLLGVEVEA